jgi:hypothetical protein
MDDICDRINEHDVIIAEIKSNQANHMQITERHQAHIGRLDAAMTDLKERFGLMATHDDILELHTKIDGSVNGLLKDALNAIPQKAHLWIIGITGTLTITVAVITAIVLVIK